MAWAKIIRAAGGAVCIAVLATACDAAPRPGARAMGACAPAGRPGLLAESRSGRIVFGGGVQRVTLAPACGGVSLAERVRGGDGRRFILLADDLRARHASGAVFSLRFAASPGGIEGEDPVLGTLNFFAARPPEAPGSQRRMSYDVTATVRALAHAGRLDHGLVVVLMPSESPAPGAELSVARLQLVEQ